MQELLSHWKLVKSIRLSVYSFYFNKNGKTYKSYTFHGEVILFIGIIMKEFLKYVRLSNLAMYGYIIKMIFLGRFILCETRALRKPFEKNLALVLAFR